MEELPRCSSVRMGVFQMLSDYSKYYIYDEELIPLKEPYAINLLEPMLLNLYQSSLNTLSLSAIEDFEKSELIFLNKRDFRICKTLFDFINLENIKLENMQYLTSFNGLTFSELPFMYQRRLQETTFSMNLFHAAELNHSKILKLKCIFRED